MRTWFLNNGLQLITTLATVATAVIALLALRNWKHQDRAKREAEFLDALIDAAHAYIVGMAEPITLLEIAKIGMESHVPTWEAGDEADKAVRGAIAYIQERGKEDAKRLRDVLEAVRPSVIKLRSLAAKGQVFKFKNYAKCQNAVEMLTWHFDRIEAFTVVIGSPTWNWGHPDVLKNLKIAMGIGPDNIRASIEKDSIAVLEFAAETYQRIYANRWIALMRMLSTCWTTLMRVLSTTVKTITK